MKAIDEVKSRRRFSGRVISIAGLLLLAAAGRAWGGAGVWTAMGGTAGGRVKTLAVDPADARHLLAATAAAGIFRSGDGGRTWEAAPGLPSRTEASVVVFDPRRPRTVYAGLAPAQSFKSVDGGDSWTPLSGGPFDGQLLSLAFAPRHPNVAYALSGKNFFASADGGATWQLRGTLGNGSSFATIPIQVSPFDADALLIGALLSTDGGRSWTGLSPNVLAADSPQRVLFDPLHPGVILYGAVDVGIFRSEDGGRSWSDVTPGHPKNPGEYLLQDMAFSWDGRRLFAGAAGIAPGDEFFSTVFQESGDGGLHWTNPSAPAPFDLDQFLQGSLVADPAGGKRLYATTRWGIYWSADGGGTWESRSDGLVAGAVVDLLADSRLPGTMYAVSQTDLRLLRSNFGALSRSEDGGATWHFLRGGIADPLTADPMDAGTFYSGLLRFTAAGESATRVPYPYSDDCLSTAEMVVDPAAPSTLYLMMQAYTGYGCHFGDLGLAKSSDGGLTWAWLDTAPVIDDLAFGAPHRTLYGESYVGGASSHDGGKIWTDFNLGLPSGFYLESFALGQGSGRLYLSGSWYGSGQGHRAVFRSEDGAARWQLAGPVPLGTSPQVEPFALVADPHVAATVYGYGGGRFFRSLDGGASWTEHSAGLGSFELTGPLLLDPHRPGRVLAGTASGLVIEIELPRSSP